MKQAIKMIAAGLAIAAPLAVWSQPQDLAPNMMPGNTYGQGMMGSHGQGMMRGNGSDMMGGFGPGMMDPYTMGGYGPGMMGDCGPGNYRGGGGVPDLTAEQQTKIQAIQEQFRGKQWELMGKMRELSLRSGMMGAGRETFDEPAARKAYDEMAALRKQMFENRLDARKKIDALLTDKQREQRAR
ncbi:Spy/CpxP family protein refolding chaperone [Alcaligenaceae bacterium]|nr:Spy/CpxP family protein refolding chaperone [Alcaligenaceae bacterium]